MRVLMINNDGGGFADHVEVADRITVGVLFAERMPGRRPGDYLIRVNRQPAAADQVLQPGDRISLTPTKIEGAHPLVTVHGVNCWKTRRLVNLWSAYWSQNGMSGSPDP